MSIYEAQTTPIAPIAYGTSRIPLILDHQRAAWNVIVPQQKPPHPHPEDGFMDACLNPIGCAPLRTLIQPGNKVVIVTADGTRPVPNKQLIPWLLDELPVPPANVTILLGTGTHRANTPDEIEAMFGKDLMKRVAIVNHDAFSPADNIQVGEVDDGVPVSFARRYVEADIRIAVGFIEPHFFAGFSGGAKAIAPGVASIDSIYHLHRYDLIADPASTWGKLDRNPLRGTAEAMAALCPPDFLLNVSLNTGKEITAFFAGDYVAAHRTGCEHVRKHAMAQVPEHYPLVVTSNSGYPLDQNLYQSVKGMSAAARIVQPGGTVIMASECRDGIPSHGDFGQLIQSGISIQEVDTALRTSPKTVMDQWQAQALAQVCEQCDVSLFSQLDPALVERCKLRPIADLQQTVQAQIDRLGRGVPVAVMPEGPLTIPYVA